MKPYDEWTEEELAEFADNELPEFDDDFCAHFAVHGDCVDCYKEGKERKECSDKQHANIK